MKLYLSPCFYYFYIVFISEYRVAQKDYVSRAKKNGQRKKTTSRGKKSTSVSSNYKSWLMLVVVVGAFIAGLYFLKTSKQDKPAAVTPTQQTSTNKINNKNNVPPLPEKRWGYPDQLTNPGANNNTSGAGMSAEQQRILAEMAADRPQRTSTSSTYNEQVARQSTASSSTSTTPAPVATTPPTRPANTANTETANTKPATATPSTNSTSSTPTTSTAQTKSWSLQCGAFRNKDGAESIKAQLALSGIASQVIFSNNLHRVVIGPFSTQSAANSMQARTKNAGVSGCSVRS